MCHSRSRSVNGAPSRRYHFHAARGGRNLLPVAAASPWLQSSLRANYTFRPWLTVRVTSWHYGRPWCPPSASSSPQPVAALFHAYASTGLSVAALRPVVGFCLRANWCTARGCIQLHSLRVRSVASGPTAHKFLHKAPVASTGARSIAQPVAESASGQSAKVFVGLRFYSPARSLRANASVSVKSVDRRGVCLMLVALIARG